jgi:hypothetical protein
MFRQTLKIKGEVRIRRTNIRRHFHKMLWRLAVYLVLGAEPSSAGNGSDDLNALLTSRITHTDLQPLLAGCPIPGGLTTQKMLDLPTNISHSITESEVRKVFWGYVAIFSGELKLSVLIRCRKWCLFCLLLLSCFPRNRNSVNKSSLKKNPEAAPFIEDQDLKTLLETRKTEAAFEDYRKAISKIKNPTSEKIKAEIPRSTILYAGKHIFNYALPNANGTLPQFYLAEAMTAWPELVGPAFKNVGLFENPDDPGFPIGFPKSHSNNPFAGVIPGGNRSVATCAMCHLGRTDDGRFVYGLPNSHIRPGRLALILSYPIWILDQRANDPEKWDPRLISKFTALKKQAQEKGALFAKFSVDLTLVPRQIPLTHSISGLLRLPGLGVGDQRDMLSEQVGAAPTFFVALGTTESLTLAMPSLWGIESYPKKPYDLDKTRISSFIPAPDLETHMAESLYMAAGGNREYTGIEWQVPLAEFIRTFRAPKNSRQPNEALYQQGEILFKKHCQGCHDNNQGGSGKMFSAETMGLLKKFNNPFFDSFQPSGEFSRQNSEVMKQMMKEAHPSYNYSAFKGVRPRRLKGAWALQYMTTAGGLRGLSHALCLNGMTRSETSPTRDESDSVHLDLCTKYDQSQRNALSEFLTFWN